MPGPIDLQILTPTGSVVHTQVSEVYVPSVAGLAGVLADHRPYVTELGAGEVHYRETTGACHSLFVSGGFLENHGNQVVILADLVEPGEELDVAALERQLAESLARSGGGVAAGLDAETWQAEAETQRILRLKLDIVRRQQAG